MFLARRIVPRDLWGDRWMAMPVVLGVLVLIACCIVHLLVDVGQPVLAMDKVWREAGYSTHRIELAVLERAGRLQRVTSLTALLCVSIGALSYAWYILTSWPIVRRAVPLLAALAVAIGMSVWWVALGNQQLDAIRLQLLSPLDAGILAETYRLSANEIEWIVGVECGLSFISIAFLATAMGAVLLAPRERVAMRLRATTVRFLGRQDARLGRLLFLATAVMSAGLYQDYSLRTWMLAAVRTADASSANTVRASFGALVHQDVLVAGVLYSLALAAAYIPAALLIKKRVTRLSAVQFRRGGTTDMKSWEESNGYSPSLTVVLPRLIAIVFPAIAGPLTALF